MKNLIVFVFSFFIFNSFSQTYEMYSDVWEYVSKDSKMIVPKGGGSFSVPSDDMLKQIDTNKINSYMLESFNKFRKDYGKLPVKESRELTLSSKSYAKCLVNEFKHDYNRSDKSTSEVIATLSLIKLSNVDLSKYDINKVIADCCFDAFVGSYGHMSILLDNNAKEFGFGIYNTGKSIKICVRSFGYGL
jgi:uncharacterized protein YkwD